MLANSKRSSGTKRLMSLMLIYLASRATGWCYRSCTSENFHLIRRLRFTRLIRIQLYAVNCVHVSEYLRLVDSKLFNRIQSPSHCLSHLLPPEKHHLGLRPRVTVIHSQYVQINFVNPLLSLDAYFVFSDY